MLVEWPASVKRPYSVLGREGCSKRCEVFRLARKTLVRRQPVDRQPGLRSLGPYLADRAEVIVSYAIGIARPISVSVESFNTNHIDNQKIQDLVMKHFDLRPAAIIRNLDLRRPSLGTVLEATPDVGIERVLAGFGR